MTFFINQSYYWMQEAKKVIIAKTKSRKVPADLLTNIRFLWYFWQIYLQKHVFWDFFCRFVLIFGRKFRRKVFLDIQKPQETITNRGISWEPKSVETPAENVFKSVISRFLVVEGLVNFEIDKYWDINW
jgi:hypothetical protein